ncbi:MULTISPECIES: DUF2797 domain-containing protein [unclassified Acinetobacter]|uniref:DUF2797 domain-containing protein n=1 Tax=unclassified Acinetobacter TaxID=196816 RepID=UPI0035B885B2
MQYQGVCHKMQARLDDDLSFEPAQNTAEAINHPVQYHFVLDHFRVDMRPLLGKNVQLHWTGNIYCIGCGSKTPKSYSQGYCFKCFKTSASCDMCILKPETCHYHLGTCRDDSFAQHVCFRPHTVYLANSSGLKVGITRQVQMPTRWLDQGANQALPIMQVGSRRLSGQVEILFASLIADKTNWRALLKGDAETLDLHAEKQRLIETFQAKIQQIDDEYPDEDLAILNLPTYHFNYPVTEYPSKIVSHNLDKTPTIEGKLMGIKGQYLLLDTGVINIRKYSGYELILSHD